MTTTTTGAPVAPSEAAVQAYEVAVGALRLVDALNSRHGEWTEDDAHAAASTALRAALATLLVLTCPGADRAYYAAAAGEIYEDMFTEGRGVAESIGVFLETGWQHTDGLRPGHDVYTESATEGRDTLTRGACLCGWQGDSYRARTGDQAGHAQGMFAAQDDALGHAQWAIVAPVMTLPGVA